MISDTYVETLDRLSRLLRRKPMTAEQIAKAMGCCKPIAYARIRALGDVVSREQRAPGSKRGPRPWIYSIP
jgi:predicted transcriptional regulator